LNKLEASINPEIESNELPCARTQGSSFTLHHNSLTSMGLIPRSLSRGISSWYAVLVVAAHELYHDAVAVFVPEDVGAFQGS